MEGGVLDLSLLNKDKDSVALLLYTYKPLLHNTGASANPAHPSQLPSSAASPNAPSSQVIINYAALPWSVQPGDYLEIRQLNRTQLKVPTASTCIQGMEGEKPKKVKRPPALEDVKTGKGREGYVFRLGEDSPTANIHQIQVPDSVATAFGFQNRLEVEVRKVGPHLGQSVSNLSDGYLDSRQGVCSCRLC